MGKKTNSINLRSLKNKNLRSNVIFEDYNYSELLYQDFYIRDYLENVLLYNSYNSIAHKIGIQRRGDVVYVFLDYYSFKTRQSFYKRNQKAFQIRKSFWWRKKKKIYKNYKDLWAIFRARRRKRIDYFAKPVVIDELILRLLPPKRIRRKRQKKLRSPLIRPLTFNSFFIFSFKRLLLLNLVFLTKCKVKLYARSSRRLLSLPLFFRRRNLKILKKRKMKRITVFDIMKNYRIRRFANKVRDLNVSSFVHLIYSSFLFRNPRLLGVFLGKVLKRNIKMFRFFYFFCSKVLLSLFVSSRLKGLKVQFKGRLGTSLRKRTSIIQYGQIPLQTINANVRYSSTKVTTIYGVCGIKIWYNFFKN